LSSHRQPQTTSASRDLGLSFFRATITLHPSLSFFPRIAAAAFALPRPHCFVHRARRSFVKFRTQFTVGSTIFSRCVDFDVTAQTNYLPLSKLHTVIKVAAALCE
jgi:hypothetical protein